MAKSHFYRTFEKPLQHLGTDDWQSRTNQACNLALHHRTNAFDLRQSSQNLRNESQVHAHYNTINTNARLANRVQELDRWCTELRLCLNRLHKEINFLCIEKRFTENELDALNVPLSVLTECLSMRDGRMLGELTADEATDELKRELLIVENNGKLLRDQCQKAWEQLNRLNEIKVKLNVELLHKDEARNCDNQQRMLGENFANISFKTDPMRNPKNSCAYEGWLGHSKQVKQLADAEVENSCRLRESLFVARGKVKNSLQSQQEFTEHTLRKRIFDTQRARNEFEWQIIKNKNEMKITIKEIEQLANALEENSKAIRLAETRLENRCKRPGMELCMDHVYTGLCDELKQLHFAQHQLNEKSRTSKTSYNELEANLQRLETELKKKQHTLTTDIRAIDSLQRLKNGSVEDGTSENRQIALTNLQKET